MLQLTDYMCGSLKKGNSIRVHCKEKSISYQNHFYHIEKTQPKCAIHSLDG